jgi:hypothetical protein
VRGVAGELLVAGSPAIWCSDAGTRASPRRCQDPAARRRLHSEAVSLIWARGLLRRSRRRLAVAFVVVTATSLVTLHHGVPMDMHEMPAAAICLAVLGAGVAVASAAGARFFARLPLPVDWLVPLVWLTEPRSIPARAGPLYLHLAVLRR